MKISCSFNDNNLSLFLRDSVGCSEKNDYLCQKLKIMGTLLVIIVIAGAIYFFYDWKKKNAKEKALTTKVNSEIEQKEKDTKSILSQYGEPTYHYYGNPEVMIFESLRKVAVGSKVFAFDDIVTIEVSGVKHTYDEPDKVIKENKQGFGSTIGRAAVGVAVAGVVGGVVGAATANNSTTTIKKGEHKEFNDYWVTIKLKNDEFGFGTTNDEVVEKLSSLAPSK